MSWNAEIYTTTVRTGEIALFSNFSFPSVFSTLLATFPSFLSNLKLSSANSLGLVGSKDVSFMKEFQAFRGLRMKVFLVHFHKFYRRRKNSFIQ